MRHRNQCPKCQGEDLLVVDPWHMPNPRTSNTTLAAQVAFRVTATERYVAAQLQLWVCAYCGYSELYTAGAQNLAQLADQGVAGVKRITRSSGGGAFR